MTKWICEKRDSLKFLFEKWYVLFLYGIVLFSMFFAVNLKMPYLMIIPIASFLVWDILFQFSYFGSWNAYGRSCYKTLRGIRAAATNTSYFLAFAAIFLGFAIEDGLSIIIKMTNQSPFYQGYVFVLLTFSGLVLLFIPVQYISKSKTGNEKIEDKEPTCGVKSIFFVTTFAEKVVITLIIYLLIEFLRFAVK